jgi:hypothetical protein
VEFKRNRMKCIAAALAAVSTVIALTLSGVAQSREFRFSVSGSGSAIASDRQAAIDEAYDRASDQARAVCVGGSGQISRDRFERTGTNCFTVGGDDNPRYSCMVFVRAECISRRR